MSIVKYDAVAPFLFGAIERFIGIVHQPLAIGGFLVQIRYADADRNANDLPLVRFARQHQFVGFHVLAYPFCQCDG